jgi:two-component system chemotaxis response regulator CheY
VGSLATTHQAARKRVLIADDSSLVRLYYRTVLEAVSCEVEEAINGIEALEKALAPQFDLVILDVNMPKMDGFTFLHTLRRSAPPAATVPVLVISTESGGEDVADARRAGANFYLIKPVSETDLRRHAAALAGMSP